MTTTAALASHWWMMAARGALAIAFGVSILAAPNVTLPLIVGLFGCYAILDGAWAVLTGLRVSRPWLDAWPVILEGIASLGLGTIALCWPFVSVRFILFLAAWGLVTGLLEVVTAWRLPREVPAHWLQATAGASSIFLAVAILMVRHADVDLVGHAIAMYGLVFGAALMLAAFRFQQTRRHRAPARAL